MSFRQASKAVPNQIKNSTNPLKKQAENPIRRANLLIFLAKRPQVLVDFLISP